MAITVYYVPQDQAALEQELASPEPKHVWHDVPANRYVVYTGEDLLVVPTSDEQ